MTDLQKTEFEMLKIFIDICKKLDLTYYLVCGSALGAAKYQGFIPWDDDIDVAMPRDEYELFIRKAPEMLPEWCFLQNYKTDLQFPLLGSKLRDSRTTYIESMCDKLDINHGVFIDIFPLDEKWKTKKDQKEFTKLQREYEGKRRVRLVYNRFSPSYLFNIRNNFYYLIYRFFNIGAETWKIIKKYDEFISAYDTKEHGIWCNHANSISVLEYAPYAQYGKGTELIFEGIKVRVPENYDAYLTQKYGDWRADLPKEEQKGHHYYVVCDLNKSYKEYITKLPNGKIKVNYSK